VNVPDRRRAGKAPTRPIGVLERTASGALALFFFFSNRLGCLGSLAVTALGTLVILFLLGFL
jgi:hypothetical protein